MPERAMTGIELQNVTGGLSRKRPAVRDLSLAARQGEFTVLLGPGGCGKTAALRIIAGLERARKGKVLIGERDVTSLAPERRGLSMVFQPQALFDTMTVRGNLSFGLEIRKRRPDKIAAEVDRVAQMLGIKEILGLKPGQLEEGSAQRVALARAIIRNPEACLLDSPLEGLGPGLKSRLQSDIVEIQRELGITAICATRDPEEAMALGDMVAVMRDGKIVQAGSPADIYSRPNSMYVAAQMGNPKMNLVPAPRILRGKKAPGFPMPKKARQSDLVVGMHPEHLQLQTGGKNSLSIGNGLVTAIENRGYSALAHIMLSGGAGELLSRVTPSQRSRIEKGTDVEVLINPSNLFFFSAETGDRLE